MSRQFPPESSAMARQSVLVCFSILLCVISSGCSALSSSRGFGMSVEELAKTPLGHEPGPLVDSRGNPIPPDNGVPSQIPPYEMAKVAMPEYRVEAPDILLINAVRLVPKDPYFIQTFDVLEIVVPNSLIDQPIAGPFQVEPNGTINLGAAYDVVKVEGLTLDEAKDAISKTLQRVVPQPQVRVTLLQIAGQQAIANEHAIAPDGTVNLGIYGTVFVAGMTVNETRAAIEKHLEQYLDKPKVAVDVFTYNSKVYYIVTEGAGLGDNVVRLPVTGNETVLDALATVGGLSQLSSKRIWIARPAPQGVGCDQVLPIDWNGITRGAATATNYQLMPGDRVFIAEDRMVAFSSMMQRIINPFEQALGFALLGSRTIQDLQRFPRGSISF